MEQNSKSSRWMVAVAIAVLSCVLSMGLVQWAPVATLENKTIDWRLRFRLPNFDYGKEISVVLIDDAALEDYAYQRPIPRDLLAELISVVSKAGAKRISVDVFLKDLTWEGEDEELVQSLQASGNVTIASNFKEVDGKTIWDLPHPIFLDSVDSTGVSGLPIDPNDQIIRRALASQNQAGLFIPTLAGAMFLATGGGEIGKPGAPKISEKSLPSFAQNSAKFIVDFLGPPSSVAQEDYAIKTFPASSVISGLILKKWFAGKYVLIGMGSSDKTHTFRTPYYSEKYKYPLTPSVEIHANVLATLLNGGKIKPVPDWESVAIVLIMVLFTGAVAFVYSLIVTVFFTTVIFTGFVFGNFAYFGNTALLLPIVPVGLGMGFAFLSTVVYRLTWERSYKRWLKNAFQMHLPPEIAETLVESRESLDLTGEKRELTLLFTDLEGFTAISESTQPKELVDLLSCYFDGMTEILFKHGGTLDQYVGDALAAFWNAPITQEDHAERALLTALEMIEFTDRFNRSFKNPGQPEIRTRIGINTGQVVVGNAGSKGRFNYTVMGSEVNLAARLESINKEFGTYLTISQSVLNRVRSKVVVRKLDVIRLKSNTQPVTIHELLGKAGKPLDDKVQKVLKIYNEGLDAYERRHWETAVHLFAAALELNPSDGPSKVYLKRCRDLRNNPAAENWDGVYTLPPK